MKSNAQTNAKSSPVVTVSFYDLMNAFAWLHAYQKTYMDGLHDVWTRGAPTPNSRLLNPKAYDPRYLQQGNYEKRIVAEAWLSEWAKSVANERGIAVDNVMPARLRS